MQVPKAAEIAAFNAGKTAALASSSIPMGALGKAQPTTLRERALVLMVQRIVTETMDYPPICPMDTGSYLPNPVIEEAQALLDLYGARVPSLLELSRKVPA